jgi:chromate transporter
MSGDETTTPTGGASRQVIAVFLAFLQLGLTSFGGPVAHLGYFREAFVVRRRWLDEHAYADIVALCQFLPGPASSQVGMAVGLVRAGLAGALAAWVAFTLPSALLLTAFGYGVLAFAGSLPDGLLHGLKVVAVAVVAQAVWSMQRNLCPDAPRIAIALLAAAAVLALPMPAVQIAAIIAGGLAGLALPPGPQAARPGAFGVAVGRRLAIASLAGFFVLLAGLPLAATIWPSQALALTDTFYRAGALVFGGGHVVLPLLQSAVVPPGWVGNDAFLAGYGAAQAVPGPLFTFAAYLGTVAGPAPNGWQGAAICIAAIFVPSFLLVTGAMPFWDRLRQFAPMRRAMLGVNAAVVGLLLAALWNPVITSAILGPGDVVLAIAALALLTVAKLPPWLVVILCALGGWGLEILPFSRLF